MFFPLMIDLSKFKILIVGAGKISLKKIKKLYDFLEEITVISKKFSPEFKEFIEKKECQNKVKKVILIEKSISISDIENFDLVYVATDNKELNKEISQFCLEKKILVNSVDNHENSTFINTGFFEKNIDEERVIFSLSCLGKNPRKTKILKDNLKNIVDREDFKNIIDKEN